MAFDFHKDKQRYFQMQYENSKTYVLQFVQSAFQLPENARVLEIGSAEGGVLKAFTELGHQCVGIELSPSRVELANQFMAEEIAAGKVEFISRNIYDINPEEDLGFRFDLVILKDVIEHIDEQEKFIPKLKDFLAPKGKVFFGFPPWYMPYGGHQQICKSKLLSVLPWFHLLPSFLYKAVLKIFGETPKRIDELLEIKETGISIERFEKLLKLNNFFVVSKTFYLVNPIYSYKFGLKVKKQFGFISAIPWIRDFFTTAVYYLVEQNPSQQ